MEQCLAKANDEKRAAEVECDAFCRDSEGLTKVQTLEREAQRAKGGRAPRRIVEGELEGPTAERAVVGGAPNPTGTRFLLAGEQAWHPQAEAVHGQMSAVATGLRMALPQNQMDVEAGTGAPNMTRVAQAHNGLVQQYAPQRLTAATSDANFGAEEQSSQGVV